MLIYKTAVLFDRLREFWRKPQVSRRLSLILLLVFLAVLLLTGLKKTGLLPGALNSLVSENPYYAVQVAFALVLGLEVVELVFAVAESVSLAVSKQLEIMSLLMLREAFTDIGLLHGPLDLQADSAILLQIAIVAVSGLLLFIFRAVFVKLHSPQGYSNLQRYISVKKCISLYLLLVVVAGGAYDIYGITVLGNRTVFFQLFYTSLIFSDILLVLVNQYYMPSFHATFRNSGYAVGTLLMRIALGAPHYAGAVICVFAGLYVLALAWATARFLPVCPARPAAPAESAPPEQK